MVKQSCCQFGEEGHKGTSLEGLHHLPQDLESGGVLLSIIHREINICKGPGAEGARIFKEQKGSSVTGASRLLGESRVCPASWQCSS